MLINNFFKHLQLYTVKWSERGRGKYTSIKTLWIENNIPFIVPLIIFQCLCKYTWQLNRDQLFFLILYTTFVAIKQSSINKVNKRIVFSPEIKKDTFISYDFMSFITCFWIFISYLVHPLVSPELIPLALLTYWFLRLKWYSYSYWCIKC